jgi:integrase
MAKNAKVKPTDFPLYLHPSGQWARRVKHPDSKKWHTFYFGRDRDEAAKRWNAERDSLFAGVTPKGRASDKPSVAELGNLFIAAQKAKNAVTGKPGMRHIDLCEYTLHRLISMIGKECVVDTLGPADYARIKLELFKPIKRTKAVRGKVFGRTVEKRAPETVAGDVRRIKIFLNWCHDNVPIDKPRYGKEFASETQIAITKESLKSQTRKDMSAKDIMRIIEAARVNFKPLVWLAINSGCGNTDLASIELDDLGNLKDKECWVNLPRLKTGADRRFLLWPETKTAIRNYLLVRPSPKPGYENVLFLTAQGFPWLRGTGHAKHIDTMGGTFTRLRKELGIVRGSFYDLRRTFATIACETRDSEAVRHVMGHKSPKDDMLAGYVQSIDDDRLRRVTDHIRKWLIGGAK